MLLGWVSVCLVWEALSSTATINQAGRRVPPRTRKVEAGDTGVQGHSQPRSKFKAILSCAGMLSQKRKTISICKIQMEQKHILSGVRDEKSTLFYSCRSFVCVSKRLLVVFSIPQEGRTIS